MLKYKKTQRKIKKTNMEQIDLFCLSLTTKSSFASMLKDIIEVVNTTKA